MNVEHLAAHEPARSTEAIGTIVVATADSAAELETEQQERDREKRRQARKQRAQARISQALKDFPDAPDMARVAPDVLDALLGRSPVTRWRLIRKGRLPQPGSDGCFAAGALRVALAALGQS